MPPQFRHLHSRPAQPEIVPQEQQLQQSSSGGALPRVDGISKQNWSGQHNNVNMENSTVAVDYIRDTVDGSFDQRFAALKSIAEDRVNDRKLESLLKKKSAPICYVWCDPSPGCTYLRTILEYSRIFLLGKIQKDHRVEWPDKTVRRRWYMLYILVDKWSLLLGTLLQVDIWLLGKYQHDANLLAREYCKRVKRRNKPIAVSHNILPNLLLYLEEEHRRNPFLAIYMRDNEVDITRKIINAFCPPKLVESNPCLGYIKYIIFPWYGKFEVARKEEDGGDKTFLSMEELTADYVSGALQPGDMKLALAESLKKILQPVRDHFRSNVEAKNAYEGIKEYYIAR